MHNTCTMALNKPMTVTLLTQLYSVSHFTHLNKSVGLMSESVRLRPGYSQWGGSVEGRKRAKGQVLGIPFKIAQHPLQKSRESRLAI